MKTKSLTRRATKWLWPLACLVTLFGYFGSWVAHPVAGLAITGLDLGEYVKFLPPVFNGDISIWRQGFYLPLIVVSFTCSLLAYRRVYGYALWMRFILLLLGLVAALNLLPPAWSPAILKTDEFRLQTIVLLFSAGLLGLSPALALLPRLPVYGFLAVTCIAALWFPAAAFLRVLPVISSLYNRELQPGWGFYISITGLMLLLAAYWLGMTKEEGPVHR